MTNTSSDYLRLNWSPYLFQSVGLEWLDRRREAGIYWSPLFMCTGSGKSLVTLEDMMRAAERGARRFLIAAPLSVTGDWLEKAIEFNFPMRMARVTRGMSREARIRLIKSKTWDVLVVNYDSIRLLAPELIEARFDYVVFDEAQRLKNHKAAQTKAARDLARDVKSRKGVRIALSGTPAPKNCLDYWSIFDVLDPYSDERIKEHHPLGLGSYRDYENLVAIREPHPRLKGVFKVSFHPMMLDLVKKRVGAHAYQVTKEEALPFLPEQRFEKTLVDMTPVQAKLYNLMKEDAVLAIQGERSNIGVENVLSLHDYLGMNDDKYVVDRQMLKKGIVTAKIQTVVMLRLHQITCGHTNLADGTIKYFENGKIERLEDDLPQWCDDFEDNKAIIFTAYRPSVKLLGDLAESLDIGAVILTGDTSGKAQEMVQKFQKDPKVRLFIINLAAGSTGITLTRANRVCYYASTYNWEHRRQSEDRAHRIGQVRSVTYTDLMVRNSVEQYIFKKVQEKGVEAALTTTSFIELINAH